MEGAITYPAVAQIFTLLITGGGALVGLWAYIDRQIKASATASSTRSDEIEKRVEKAERDLADYKLHVSERFIKAGDLEKMERRLMDTEARTLAALEQLTKRIDSLISEINSNPRRGRGGQS